MSAVYEQNASTQREVQNRRVEVDGLLQEHEQAIQELSTALAALPSHAEDAAAVAAEIDKLQFGDAFRFARQLEPVLIQHQNTLKSRKSESREMLPAYTDKLYREVRSATDDDYRQQLEREQAERARQQRVQAEKAQRSKLTKSAVVDQETGHLLGYQIKDEQGNNVRFEKIKRVPIAST
jgi:hypothetical protein